MKHWIRFGIVFFVAACIFLSGCNQRENPDTPQDVEQNQEQDVSTPSEITLIENGVSVYTIVYADSSDADYRGIARDIQRQIERYTGVKLNMIQDGDAGVPTQNCILVGPTSFAESKSTVDGLRAYDYVVRTAGNHLVFGVISETAAGNALDVLIDAIANYDKNAGEPLRVTLNQSFAFTGYRIHTFTVAGTPLKDFTIVYGKADNAEAAEAVQAQIFDAYGYFLPIVMDREADPAGCEILVGETKRPASKSVETPDAALTYLWAESDGNLVLKSAGLHSLIRAAGMTADHFSELGKDVSIEAGYTAVASLHKPAWDAAFAEGADIRVMSTNVLADTYLADHETYPDAARRSEMLFAMLEYYQPTILGAQEFDTPWWTAWSRYTHKKMYSYVTANNPHVPGERYFSPILYRKDILELEESDNIYYEKYTNGRCRVMCWGVFKIKATGERFIFFNTHWDVDQLNDKGELVPGYKAEQAAEAAAMIRNLEAKYNLPVICTADWNVLETSGIMVNFLKETDMVNTRQVLHPEQLNYIDMILATKNVSVLRWERLEYHKKPDLGTDHPWVMADLQLPD